MRLDWYLVRYVKGTYESKSLYGMSKSEAQGLLKSTKRLTKEGITYKVLHISELEGKG